MSTSRLLLLAFLLPSISWAWQDNLFDALDNDSLERASRVVELRLNDQPDDVEAQLWQARLAAMAGDHERAAPLLEGLAERYPNDADIWFALGQQRTWAGDEQAAKAPLQQALLLAPQYQDVWLLTLQIHQRAAQASPSAQTIGAYRELHQDATAQVPEIAARFPADPVPPFSWQGRRMVEVGVGAEYLSIDTPTWNAADLGIQWQDSHDRLWYSAVRHTRRFDLDDQELNTGVVWPIGQRQRLLVDASYSDTAQIRPRWSAYAGWYFSPINAVGVQPGIRRSSFSTSNTTTYTLFNEYYRGNWRYGYNVFFSSLHGGGNATTHVIDARYYYRDSSHVGLSLAKGRDIESIPNGELITPTQGVAVFGEHGFSQRWSMTWLATFNEQGDLYERYGWRLALRYRF